MAAATSSNDTNVRVGASTLRSTENTKSKIPAGTQTSHKQDTTVTESTPFTPKQDTPARLEVMVGHDLAQLGSQFDDGIESLASELEGCLTNKGGHVAARL